MKKQNILQFLDELLLRPFQHSPPCRRKGKQRPSQATDALEARCLLSAVGVNTDTGVVTGQKWHDLDADGIKDANEPGLDGWNIQLLDDNGSVVAEAVTESVDLNTDGQIDPFTESGLYSITAAAGTWRIGEVQQTGWQQTTPSADSPTARLYGLDQRLSFHFTGKYFENWGGLGEKWILSSVGWHYVKPNGDLFQWDGTSRVPLLGQLIGQTSPDVHQNPTLLHDAPPPAPTTITIQNDETTHGIDFGNVPTGSIAGRTWNDINADRVRTTNEPWLNGWAVHLEDSVGNIVATTFSSDVDRNNDGRIDPETESGWYSFNRIVPGDYRVSETTKSNWTLPVATGQLADRAYELDQDLDFRHPVSSFFNWGGLRERWFWSRRQSWHYITPDGGLYKWNGSSARPLSGTLVAQFEPEYWERPALIYNAPNPDPYGFSITGQKLRNVDFGNVFSLNGSGAGDLNLAVRGTTVIVSGNDQANSLAVYGDSQGYVLIQGSGGTTINGSTAPVFAFPHSTGFPGNLVISLRGGHDQIVVFDALLDASLHVDVGTGNDIFMLADSHVGGDVSVTSPRGDGQVRLLDSTIAGTLSVFTSGDGHNLTSLQDVAIGRNLSVTNSGGVDTVFLQGASVTSNTDIVTGRGADSIIVHRSLFLGDVAMRARNGNDLIALLSTDFSGPLHLYAGNNDDVVGNMSGNRFAFDTGFYAGPGNDTYADDETATYGRIGAINSFEVEDDSSLTRLVDLVLSNFDNLLLN